MDQKVWTTVENYFNHLLIPTDDTLEAALTASEAAGLPPINVAPHEGKLLYLLARSIGAQRILEVGTLAGYSTIWLGRALPTNGRLLTLELDPHHATVARNNIAEAGLASKVEVQVGRALNILTQMVAEDTPPFDFIFIDADKPSNPHYFQYALQLAHPGSLIIIDNVVRHGTVTDANSQDANVQGVRQLIDLIAAEPRVTATTLQTVGSKGYDGFTLILVDH